MQLDPHLRGPYCPYTPNLPHFHSGEVPSCTELGIGPKCLQVQTEVSALINVLASTHLLAERGLAAAES